MKQSNPTYDELEKECRRLQEQLQNNQQNYLNQSESEANLNSVINNQEESIWSIDKDYNYIITNNHFKAEYYKNFNIELKKGTSVFHNLPQPLIDIWKPKYDKALNGERVVFEFTHYTDEKPNIYKISLNPVITDGEICGVSALSINITDRKFAEQQLKETSTNMMAIMENTSEHIWAINTNYEIIFANTIFVSAFEDSFGVKLEPGTNIIDSLIEPLRPIWKQRYDRALKNERFTFIDQIDIGNGHFVYVEVLMNPMLVEDNIVGASVFANDITERKTAEFKLKENEKRLEKLNKNKDKFFSIIAHDLKGPFNSILGLSELLCHQINEGKLDDVAHYSKIIQYSSNHAVNLLSNLLEWSRSQSGIIEFNPKQFEFNNLVKEEIKGLESLAQQKSITIHNKSQQSLYVFADYNMLSTVMRNLISNAIKFTQNKGIIEITTIIESNELTVSVRDNGIGIEKDIIKKLFAIDKNHSTPGTENESGTGLGLILCQEFIEKHNGQIWVESKINEGSTFSFSLPLSEQSNQSH